MAENKQTYEFRVARECLSHWKIAIYKTPFPSTATDPYLLKFLPKRSGDVLYTQFVTASSVLGPFFVLKMKGVSGRYNLIQGARK